MSLFGGEEPKIGKHQIYGENQMAWLDQLIRAMSGETQGKPGGMNPSGNSSGAGFLDYFSNLLNPNGGQGDFNNFAQPYQRQFQEQDMPMMAERFAGAGGGMGGGLSSSGFAQALSGGQSNLNAQLAQLFASLRQNAAGQMSGLTNSVLGAQPYALTTQPGSPGAGLGLAGGAIGSMMGPLGTAIGTGAGNWLANKNLSATSGSQYYG